MIKMNPLSLFYKPRRTVEHYLSEPHMAKSLIFVLLPGIISVAGLILYGFKVDFLVEVFNFLSAVLSWIIASILISFVIVLFSRKSIAGEFYGIASAVSLTRFLGAIAVFLFLLLPLILPAQIFGAVKSFHEGKATLNELNSVVSVAVNSQEFSSALPVVGIIILLVSVFGLLSVFVYYEIISRKLNSSFFVHLIALLCFLFLDLVFIKIIGL
jgi:hypothetical protein